MLRGGARGRGNDGTAPAAQLGGAAEGRQRLGRRGRSGRRDTLVAIDGMNVMFSFGKMVPGPLVPRSRGLQLCLEHFLERNESAVAVAFVPADVIEGPLWRVADGQISQRSPLPPLGNLEMVEADVFGPVDEEGRAVSGVPPPEMAWMQVEGAQNSITRVKRIRFL